MRATTGGATPDAALPAGGGEMGDLVRAFDWDATPLGPPARWPQSLRTTVRILLTSKFAMWMGWGPDLTFLYNDAYGRMTLGRKHPWALGRPAREVWAEIWRDLEPRVRTVMESGEATWDEALLLFLERSGYSEETYHTFSYSPLAGDDGTVAGLFCVVSEETERVIGERRLDTLRELASALAATAAESDVLRAVERTVRANPHDLPFALGYQFDEAGAARRVFIAGMAETHAAAPETLPPGATAPWPAAAIAAGEGTVAVSALGERFDALPTGAWDRAPDQALVVPIARRGQEQPAGFVVAGLNPYRQRDAGYQGFVELFAGQIAASLANARAYEEERQRARALAELDRAKTTFFSNVSHEFRTPLALMLGPAEDVLADATTTSANRERMEVIHRNALRLLKLVNSLLDFARAEAGRVEARFEPTDLASYTADLASSFRSAMERAGLRLVVDAPPPSAALPPVYVDHDMWEKVILNLLSNAFKHTFEGEIAVRVRREGDRALVEVSDTGVGIAAEQLPHVFDRFHRVPNAKSRTHEGTGIGLALVQELVRRHGGTIEARSTPDAGTTFAIALPLGTAHLPRERIVAAGVDRVSPTAVGAAPFVAEALRWLPVDDDGTSLGALGARLSAASGGDAERREPRAESRVLLADDNADMRDYVTRLLRAQGWTVETVADGHAALARSLAEPPDLVLTDVMMPGLDGFALLRALRTNAATATLPVILLSARAGEEARVEGARAGADDYLVKPFAAAELVARVGAHLSLARARREAGEAIAAARDRLTSVFEQAPVAICVLRGPELVVEIANPFYQRIVQRDLVGRPIREVLPEADAQGYVALLEQVRATGEPWVGRGVELRFDRHGTGVMESAFFNAVYQPLVEHDGSISGVIAIVVEVTEELRARHEAERARSEAEEANRAKGDFLAAMSHELRTPLNAIGGYTELIELGIHGPVTEPQQEALGRIRRSQQHLLALINDVLNFAKLEAGRVEYEFGPVHLADVVAEVVPMVEPQLAARGLTYRVDVPAGVTVRADREKLRQVLLNLLSNAVKFTESGGVTIDMGSRPDGATDVAHLRVSDTGIGIPRDRQDAIFDPFVQVHRRLTRSTEGTGLGLAISRDLARAMGGDLRVRSEEGRGTSFTLTLPLAG